MPSIFGFQLRKKIFEGLHTVVYRGLREADLYPVVVKFHKDAGPRGQAKLQREYRLLQRIQMNGVVQVSGLEKSSEGMALVMVDSGGDSLDKVMIRKKPGLKRTVSLGIRIADTLGHLHELGVIHKGINPSNIVWRPDTNSLELIGFGRAGESSHEAEPTTELPAGNLAFISPEQTGRMNRGLDYRSDYYSLGATLYKMVTGRAPFPLLQDSLSLVHAHLARIPAAPCRVDPEIPECLSEVIMKLLAKTAEERYQSSQGLIFDLKFCQKFLEQPLDESFFVTGSQDAHVHFRMSEALYGRARDIEQLKTAFENICAGNQEVVLVRGPSGVGKTTLVREIYKPVTSARGYFISGKFDQLEQHRPYSALIQAFRALFRQILTEPEENVALWRRRISKALSVNGRIMADLVPEITHLLGPQEPVCELPPGETENRFHLVFRQFFQALAEPKRPIVVFLDDVQWADQATLGLLRWMGQMAHILLICACREEDKQARDRFESALSASDAAVRTVTPLALSVEETALFIADSLGLNQTQSMPLAMVCHSRTGGIPFLMKQYFSALYEQNLVVFHNENNNWTWDLDKIRNAGVTENIAGLMVDRLARLPSATRDLLCKAACMGNSFQLKVAAALLGETPAKTLDILQPALEQELVLPDQEWRLVGEEECGDATFHFFHDKIQTAAYDLLEQEERINNHLALGRWFKKNRSGEEDHVFLIVDHLNQATALIGDAGEREAISRDNLEAANRALATAAYRQALRYLETGVTLLPDDCWSTHYDLTLDLYRKTARAAYLSGEWGALERVMNSVLTHGRNLMDKVDVLEIKLRSLWARNELEEAVVSCFGILKQLGVTFPRQPGRRHILQEMFKTRLAMRGRPIASLLSLPQVTDPMVLERMRSLSVIGAATYATKPELLPLTVCRTVQLSIKYGNSPWSAVAYTLYGSMLCSYWGQYDVGYRFGKMGRDLLKQMGDRRLLARQCYLFNIFVRSFREPHRNAIEDLWEGYENGLAIGDFESAAICLMAQCSFVNASLFPLTEIADKHRFCMKRCLELGIEGIYKQAGLLLLCDLRLMNEEPKPRDMGRLPLVISEFPALFKHSKDIWSLFFYLLEEVRYHYIMESFTTAMSHGEEAEKYSQRFRRGAPSSMTHMLLAFYRSLTMLALVPFVGPRKKKVFMKKVAQIIKLFGKLAATSPGNFQHRLDMILAERLRVLGKPGNAVGFYDRAIAGARETGLISEEALAYELAARFYQEQGNQQIGQYFLQKAWFLYGQWGAHAKLAQLRRRYPRFFKGEQEEEHRRESLREPELPAIDVGRLDLETILEASQTIGGEIVLERLLEKMMGIVMQNAGAQRGSLLLSSDGSWVIMAEGRLINDGDGADVLDIKVMQEQSIHQSDDGLPMLPMAAVHYVERTMEAVVLDNAGEQGLAVMDPYVRRYRTRSALCMPLLHQSHLTGLLYLENNLATGSFTARRVELLELLSSQMAISIENARFYSELEEKVGKRTRELRKKNEDILRTQNQLIMKEKIASLGMLTAGIAHEIRNPLNFVNNFARIQSDLARDALQEDNADELKETLADMEQNAVLILKNGERANSIVESMMAFAQEGPGEWQVTAINTLVERCLALARHGCREMLADLQVEERYDPKVDKLRIQPRNLTRALVNLFNNALEAVAEKRGQSGFLPRVMTATYQKPSSIQIRIMDNGPGINEEDRDHIFTHFFTRKPTGSGHIGLGLSISYDIIVKEHGGNIEFETIPGEYTEMVITLPCDAEEDVFRGG